MSKKPSPREGKHIGWGGGPGVEEAFTKRDENQGGRVDPTLPLLLLLIHEGDEQVDHLWGNIQISIHMSYCFQSNTTQIFMKSLNWRPPSMQVINLWIQKNKDNVDQLVDTSDEVEEAKCFDQG